MNKPTGITLPYRDWLNLNLRLLWCYDRSFFPENRSRGRSKYSSEGNNSAAWLVRKGWAEVQHGGRVYRANPGEWLIVKPCNRIQTFPTESRLLSVAFDAHWPDRTPLFNEGLSLVLKAKEAPLLEKRALSILKITNRIDPWAWNNQQSAIGLHRFMSLERALCSWLSALAEALDARGIHHSGQSDTDPRVMEAIRLLQAHDPGTPLKLESLAPSIGLSPIHLTRLFRRHTFSTPHQYFEKLRVEYACTLLKSPKMRIKEVAMEMGFTYLSHFSKWFRKHTGKSPRQFTKE